MKNKKVILEVRRGKGERAKFIYATLTDFETQEILVSADLTYCLEVLNDPERNYELVNGLENLIAVNTIMAGMM